jgi:type I restriction enzyme, S subunit
MTPAELIAAFETLVEAPDGVARLRDLVLQLAVRGRLVQQDPEDESANVLLRRIRSEGLVGSIPVMEPVGVIPWDLPSTWTWVRLREIVDFSIGKTPPTKDSTFWADVGGYAWVSIADMQHGRLLTSTSRRVSKKAATEVFRDAPVPAGTMLMSFKLTIGKIARLGCPAYHNEGIISMHPATPDADDYLFVTIPVFARAGDSNAAIKGATLNKSSLTHMMVALPPAPEQRRIVARVDELMGLLDRLEAARTKREATRAAARDSVLAALREADSPEAVDAAWTRVAQRMDDLVCDPADITPLRQTVLQLALRGRLVRQDSMDEPASALLERVAAEKGWLRKRKAPSSRTSTDLDDEVRFAIPDSWAWSSIGSLTSSLDYGSSAKSKSTGAVPVLRMGNLQRGSIDWTDLKFTDDPAEIEQYSLKLNTVLFNRTNSPALVGKTALYRGERPAVFAGYLIRLVLAGETSPEFVNLWMNSPVVRTWCARSRQDGVSQSNISAAKLATLSIPVPPVAEQRRIVARVEELMGLLDRLEQRLVATKATQSAFAGAAAHHVVA